MAEIEGAPERPEPRLSAPVPLTPDHDLSNFDCGEPALNDWLRHRALKNESRLSRTYVVCEGNQVIAYFCISAGAVERGKVRRYAPDTIPVSMIGRLAVSRDHAGKGLGADILSNELRPPAGSERKRAGKDQALGHSRGRLTTKVHMLTYALGQPLRFCITAG